MKRATLIAIFTIFNNISEALHYPYFYDLINVPLCSHEVYDLPSFSAGLL